MRATRRQIVEDSVDQQTSLAVHSQFDQSLWNNRMISYGLDRQKVFALAQNATSRRFFLERSGALEAVGTEREPACHWGWPSDAPSP
ncbi:hypothetical protein [Streptomyces sp. NPDC001604]|uniref:hypothetical protein n=1 Tax=Streptomyces sp. NPDC001604 TaxID=3364593 RepID=UPI0036809DD3